MLQNLSIKNYAIIDRLEIQFSKQLNIITGETGAGKSILLGALSMILGDRADSSVLRNKEEKCIIEASFDIRSLGLEEFFTNEELDYHPDTIIRREILSNGKSRAFINDSPTSLKILKDITSKLIDVHSQHETLEINQQQNQLKLIDSVALNQALVEKYTTLYKEYHQLLKKENELQLMKDNASKEADYILFQLNELEEISFENLNQEELENELKTINSAEDIKFKLEYSSNVLQESEMNIIQMNADILASLRSVKDINTTLQNLFERMNSVHIELKDIAREINLIASDSQFDGERANEINTLLTTFYKLQKKHGVDSSHALQTIKDELKSKNYTFENIDNELINIKNLLSDCISKLLKAGEELYRNRQAIIPTIEKQVMETLMKVGMPNAKFSIEHHIEPNHFGALGIDSLQFLFSANAGMPLQEVKKVASGGELSRLMLSIKSIMAQAISLPTMIFDEIDTGISGNVASKTGDILKQMSKNHQMICITHLPQIAAKGQKHFYIYKKVENNTTYTRMKELDETERIQELASMLGGETISEASIANARELLVSN
jgi:DNA repair protein RecN (Recombination protein N)